MFCHHVARMCSVIIYIVFKILSLGPNNASCAGVYGSSWGLWKIMVLGRPKSFSFAIPLPIWNLKTAHWKEFHILFKTWGDNCQVIHSDFGICLFFHAWALELNALAHTTSMDPFQTSHHVIPKLPLMGFSFQFPGYIQWRFWVGLWGSDPPFKCLISDRKPWSFHCGVELWSRCSPNAWIRIRFVDPGVDLSFSRDD